MLVPSLLNDCTTGDWLLARKESQPAYNKLQFKQDSETFCHVQFYNLDEREFREGEMYSLSGWQQLDTRYNKIIINEIAK